MAGVVQEAAVVGGVHEPVAEVVEEHVIDIQ